MKPVFLSSIPSSTLTGIGGSLGGSGDALRRATQRVEDMRNKADAMGGLLEHGVLTDSFDERSQAKRELDALKASAAVDDDLARLKAETRKEIEPPR